MSLTLYFHPLASYCHKALIAFYENGTPFTPHLVDLGDPAANAAFKAIWPIGKFPVLRDEAAGRTIPESSIVIEYLDRHFPGKTSFIPKDPKQAHEVRLYDRLCDLYLHLPMQKVIGDRMRPAGKNDPNGVEEAKAQIQTTLLILDEALAKRSWIAGDAFTLADCSAAPPLFYIDMAVAPLADTHKNAAAYLHRLKERPSYARTLEEAKPYMHLVPR
ncbi:MAG: glutathione S-transferase family protein [Pseudorhodoplanes sp.]|nr:glutathione S-transferase family protein [Pseudorhodoplanes sp.]